jgi:hypothetical protein
MVTARVKEVAPGAKINRVGSLLNVTYPDGVTGAVNLDEAFAACSHQPKACSTFVDDYLATLPHPPAGPK